jgi:hypothetical protein
MNDRQIGLLLRQTMINLRAADRRRWFPGDNTPWVN